MFVNKTIAELTGQRNRYTDHVGVEIEVEHEHPYQGIPSELESYWRVEGDGSLRVNGTEYVFRNPKTATIAKRIVAQLGKHIDSYNSVIDAGRAGVHVHVNVGDLTVRETVNFIALWHSLEGIITNWCGEYRKGNLFCLRLKDAEYIVDALTNALEREELRLLHTDEIRYSAINLKAIREYGSIELRCMRSDGNWEDIQLFIDVMMRLKDLARQFESPIQIVQECSGMAKGEFVDMLLGEYSPAFDKYVGFEDDIYDAIRMIQQYAYCKEW